MSCNLLAGGRNAYDARLAPAFVQALQGRAHDLTHVTRHTPHVTRHTSHDALVLPMHSKV